jgi:hypothetical protein
MEESELSRTIRLTNLYKQVLELTPFEKGSRELVKDVRFMRYLVLCLPFNEDVIENIFYSLLFKQQNNLFFLKNLVRSFRKILRIKDQKLASIENSSKKKVIYTFMNDGKNNDNFEEFIEKSVPIEIHINYQKIKIRCLEYLLRVGCVIDRNFIDHFEAMKQNLPFDIFECLFTAYVSSNSFTIKKEVERVFKGLRKLKIFGGKKFKHEIRLGRLRRRWLISIPFL